MIGRDVIIEMRVVVSSDDIQRTVASVMASAWDIDADRDGGRRLETVG